MLNAGTLFTLVVQSLVGLALGTAATSSPVTAPVVPAAPSAVCTLNDSTLVSPVLFELAEENQSPAEAIAQAIREVEANKELSASTKQRLLKTLRNLESMLQSGTFNGPARVFKFDGKAMPEYTPNTKNDFRLRVRGKDGKVRELNNPTPEELKAFEETMKKEFEGLRFDFKMDPKALEELRDGFKEFKMDPKALEELRNGFEEFKMNPKVLKELRDGFKEFKMDPKALKELRDGFKEFKMDPKAFEELRRGMKEFQTWPEVIVPREVPRPSESPKVLQSKAEVRRELDKVRRERQELDVRERMLRDLLDRMSSSTDEVKV
jgi:hypothetical protein